MSVSVRFPIIAVLSLTLFSVSCSKIESNDDLPEIHSLTPETIETDLDRINISAETDDLALMMTKPWAKILVQSQLDYYTPEGLLITNEPVHIEIKGAGSASNPMKSIGVHFTTKIDNSSGQFLSQQPADGDHLDLLQTINLRNSGQDYGETMVKDLAYSLLPLQLGMNLEVKYGKPIHLFFNNSYYGMLNLRTEDSQLGIANLLGVPQESVTIVKMDITNGNLELKEGDETVFNTLHNAIDQSDVETLSSMIDIDNYLDYLIYQDYIGNMDWPHNNVILFKQQGKPFRFFFFDADLAALRPKNHKLPEMEYGDDDMSNMFQVMLEDETFEERLEARQAYWYERFSPEIFNEIVDDLTKDIEGDIPYMIAKWKAPASLIEWQLSIAQLKRDFERTDHFNRKKYDF